MSDRSLTGYDNANANGGQADEEVYLYDAESNRLLCASCNPGGEPDHFQAPEGVFDTEHAGEGVGLLVDRPETWSNRWLAGSIPGWGFSSFTSGLPYALYQPRYLSDSGRLFFDSPDALVPADQNGKEDVYQYEPQGVGSCTFSGGCIGLISSGSSSQESTFLDASESGNDVFFMTSTQLVPADTDNAFDVYDAHVCSTATPCLSSTNSSSQACESTGACRPAGPWTPPQVAPPASASYSGPGNTPTRNVLPYTTTKPTSKPLTRKQKLALALKACRKLRRRHARTRCEANARKRYAPKPSTKRHAKSKSTRHAGSNSGRP